MPNFSKLHHSFKKYYVFIFVLVAVLAGFLFTQYRPAGEQSTNPIVHSQNISEITGLVARKDSLEYLVIARPMSEYPRYVFKFRDAPQVHAVKVPNGSHANLEREVLLKNAIPYSIASNEFLSRHKAVFSKDETESEFWNGVTEFLFANAFSIALFVLLLVMLKKGMPGLGSNVPVIRPESLKGSMDDLVGMADIKQEVAHLEDMIRNRGIYRSHNIDKPFNVMLTGPAGTGKTRLAGYLAKKLNVPLIQTSGSALETGLVGGGSKTLNAIYKKACKQGNCIIFLDEAQSLFVPRGRAERKYDDDTANTLLGLLDGVRSDEGAGVIWVVASNFDDANTQMDEAMLRRFSVKINFRLPNRAERRDLLQVFLSRKGAGCVDWANLDLEHVAQVTANLSPALLETVVDRSSMFAIQEKTVITTDLLVRAFERSVIGLTDRATTAEKERQRERVALHELGHFFMQIDPYLKQGLPLAKVKEKSNLLKISTESVSKLGALGYVLSSSDDVMLKTLAELEQDVTQLYGGVAVEELFYGGRGISIGSQNDIEKATRLLNLMVNKLSMYSRSKLDYSQLGQEGASTEALRQVEAKADELYTGTLAAMEGYSDVIEAIKHTLLERYVLSKDEIFELLAELDFALPRKSALRGWMEDDLQLVGA